MKIVVFEGSAGDRQVFGRLAAHHELLFDDDQLTADDARKYADADIVCPFIYSELDGHVLEELKALKMIATRSTGYEHIDIATYRERGIVVSNVPRYGEETVAEHVFALLLALSHHIVEAANRVQRGEFSLQGLLGFDLFGKTIGVIGTGAIGQHVVRIAKGFQMHVVAFDVKRNTDCVMMRLKNVIVTPHSAFYTKEAVAQILETTADNITAFLAGTPQNVVS